MNISRLYDLVLLNKNIIIYKNRFNDNIYVKFILLWNVLYLIFGEKKNKWNIFYVLGRK